MVAQVRETLREYIYKRELIDLEFTGQKNAQSFSIVRTRKKNCAKSNLREGRSSVKKRVEKAYCNEECKNSLR